MYQFLNRINSNIQATSLRQPLIQRAPQQIQTTTLNANPNITKQVPIKYPNKTVSVFIQPYLDTINQEYKNIVVLNMIPQGPLEKITVRLKFPLLSEFKTPSSYNTCSSRNCGYALRSLCDYDGNGYGAQWYTGNTQNLMVADEVPNLISFLTENGYTIDTRITDTLNLSDVRFNTGLSRKLLFVMTYTQ